MKKQNNKKKTKKFFKNDRMNQLDAFLGDIFNDIIDREEQIVRQLCSIVVNNAPTIIAR